MSCYLLEIGCEEIPARFMAGILSQLNRLMAVQLKDHRVNFESIQIFGTYRRLSCRVVGIADQQEDLEMVLKGPPVEVAFDTNNRPAPAAIGFAKRLGCDVAQLTSKDGYLVGVKFENGCKTSQILPEIVMTILNQLNLPIAMKWGDRREVFIRPVHWILSLMDDTIVPFEFCGIKAGNTTFGHRFLTQNNKLDTWAHGVELVVQSELSYEAILNRHFVDPLPENRRSIILKSLEEAHQIQNYDKALLEEVVWITEWPQPLIGNFDERFLELPDEVLMTCMKKHQKYFPLTQNNALQNRFLVVAENVTERSRQNIIDGNENVLAARLEDVRFFWEEDLKVPLESNVEKLKSVVYQKGLGSLYDKLSRLNVLSAEILGQLPNEFKKHETDIDRTIMLCKTDLVTHMVYELPSLQGVMGRLYATESGEKKEICIALEEHYFPRFSGDQIPSNEIGIVVALADKFDNIASSYVAGNIPTGSQDPWGVRRAMLGVAEIIMQADLVLEIPHLLKVAFNEFNYSLELLEKCDSFFRQRVVGLFKDKGIAYDLVDAVSLFILERSQVAYQMAVALQSFRKSNFEEFKTLVETGVRIKRIQKGYSSIEIDPALFETDAEKAAFEQLPLLDQYRQEMPHKKLELLSLFSKAMSHYFDTVLVMSDNESVKQNRLAFLRQCQILFCEIGDLEKIVI